MGVELRLVHLCITDFNITSLANKQWTRSASTGASANIPVLELSRWHRASGALVCNWDTNTNEAQLAEESLHFTGAGLNCTRDGAESSDISVRKSHCMYGTPPFEAKFHMYYSSLKLGKFIQDLSQHPYIKNKIKNIPSFGCVVQHGRS